MGCYETTERSVDECRVVMEDVSVGHCGLKQSREEEVYTRVKQLDQVSGVCAVFFLGLRQA